MALLLEWIKYGANNSGDFHWDESKKTYLNADGTVPFTGAGNDCKRMVSMGNVYRFIW